MVPNRTEDDWLRLLIVAVVGPAAITLLAALLLGVVALVLGVFL